MMAAWQRDRRAWAAVAIGAAVLCMLFRPEIAAAVSVWNTSTAYGHCWLVLPIALWLLWDRRAAAAAHPARPAPWAALAAIPAVLLWAASNLLGIMEGRQIAAMLLLLVLLFAVLGPSLWWALSAGFLYLLFLVPFGAFLTPALQLFTARFITIGLGVLDVPFDANAMQIAIPEGVFYVAEACAGLRFLIASIAFGVLYAVTMFRSPWRRAAFIAVACIVPVLANGVRGLGIVLLGHALGSAQAGAADHLIYGWVFFSLVIVLLAVAGLPFRQAPERPRPEVARAGPPRRGRLAAACIPVLLIAAAGPLLMRHGTQALAEGAPPMLGHVRDCTSGRRIVSEGVSRETLICGGESVEVTGTRLARTAGPARVLDAARRPAMAGLEGDVDSEIWTAPSGTAGQPGAPWVVARAHDAGRVSAYAFQSGGLQGIGSVRDRLRLLRAVLDPGGAPSLAWAVRLTPGGPQADPALHAVLTRLSDPAPGAAPP